MQRAGLAEAAVLHASMGSGAGCIRSMPPGSGLGSPFTSGGRISRK
jgi:hypothetical protein